MSETETPSARVVPFSVEPTIEGELGRLRLGMWIFLVSEAILFLTLFVVYAIIRVGAEDWPRGSDYLSVPSGMASATLLILSSITTILAWRRLGELKVGEYRKYQWLTVILGGLYLLVKALEWRHKFLLGLSPASHLFFGLYFTVTGLHIVHAVGGVLYNAYLAGPGLAMFQRRPQRFRNRVELAGMYWHFVDLMWLLIFPALYLL